MRMIGSTPHHSLFKMLQPLLLSITLLLSSTYIIIPTTQAFSSPSPTNNLPLQTRLQTTQAKLLLSIGRVPGTAMPPDWAASGAKLGFALEVEFTDERYSEEYEASKERLLKGDALMGNNLMMVDILNEPSFVSTNGKEVVKVLPGAYGCQMQGMESRQHALRFFMDFPEGATRNDVSLPAERIYFLSSCWSADDVSLARAQKRRDEIEEKLLSIQSEKEEIEQKASTEGFFKKALAFRNSVDLVERKGRLNAQLQELEQTYPLDESKVIRGPNDVIFAKEGMIAVKRLRGAMGTREQYHWVGTFSFNEFFEDEEEEEE